MMNSPRTLALLALLSASAAAHAGTMSANAVAPVTLGSSADWLSLGQAPAATAAPGAFTQSGTFHIGDSGCLSDSFRFSFADVVTIDGKSRDVNVLGAVHVTPTADTLTIFPGDPIGIGDWSYALRGFSLTGYDIRNYAFNLTADLTPAVTPEPASLVLLGSGALASAFAARRRAYFAGA